MEKRRLILASVAITMAISIGGYSFAQIPDKEPVNNNQQNTIVPESMRTRNYSNLCWNNEEFLQSMNENGFANMTNWMKEGNFEEINQFMSSMSEEDYKKMTDIMKEYGYGYGMMSRTNNFIGRENRINMRNSTRGNGNRFSGRRNMMNGF